MEWKIEVSSNDSSSWCRGLGWSGRFGAPTRYFQQELFGQQLQKQRAAKQETGRHSDFHSSSSRSPPPNCKSH